MAETPSTQDVAREAARNGAPARSIWVADVQTAGRGRQGRAWITPPGTALLMSALFRQQGEFPPQPHRYTMLVCVALAEAVEQAAGPVQVQVKWPNDLVLDGKKLAGVLAEAAWDGERLAVVVGAGLNVNLDPEALAQAAPTATSLLAALGRPVDRGAIFRAYLRQLDWWERQPLPDLRAAWSARLWGRGQTLKLRLPESAGDTEHQAVVLGTDQDGGLRVRLEDGRQVTTTTGELIL